MTDKKVNIKSSLKAPPAKIKQKACEKSTLHPALIKLCNAQISAADPAGGMKYLAINEMITDSMQPKDAIEALLTSQMLATHNLAMCMLIGGKVEFENGLRDNLPGTNAAVKLLNVFTRQVEALNNYRGKQSTQKIVVEQVKVESGGQAVVGNIQAQGEGPHNGDNQKK